MTRFLLIILLFCCHQVNAQKRNNTWAFGGYSGLNFNTTQPQYITTPMLASEGCASICDRTSGILLFYSNGQTVWGKNNAVMPNGTGLKGNAGTSATQGVVIAPSIADTNQYYLFVLDTFGTQQRYLYYSVIDMSLNGGQGDVVPGMKNIVLDSNMSEKMVHIKGEGCYTWLLAHRADTEFRAYKIDGTGLNPAVSSFSGFLSGNNYGAGQMAVSHDGKQLAVANAEPGNYILEIHDFNSKTGIVSNVVVISQDLTYGVCYLSKGNLCTTRIKSNNTSPDVTIYTDSGSFLHSTTFGSLYLSQLRTGPDDKAYFTGYFGYPNVVLGTGAIYIVKGGIAVLGAVLSTTSPGTYLSAGLGNNVSEHYKTTLPILPDTGICPGMTQQAEAPGGYQSYQWSTGATTPVVTITTPGIYWVKAGSYVCGDFADTFVVSEYNIPVPSFHIADSAVCPGKPLVIDAPSGLPIYTWSTGATTPQDTIKLPGKYWVEIRNKCGGVSADTFEVDDKNLLVPAFDFADSVLCPGESYTVLMPPGLPHYQWSTGSTYQGAILTQKGTYYAIASNDCGLSYTDTFSILPPKEVYCNIADTALCRGVGIEQYAPEGYTGYSWSTGEHTPSVVLNKAGNYWLSVSNRCGDTYTDSFTIEDINSRLIMPALGNDTLNCAYDLLVPIALNVAIKDSLTQILWSTGETGLRTEVVEPGTYWVTVSNECASYSDTIAMLGCLPKEIDSIWMPSAFTPNGDGKNDKFRIPYPKFQVVSVDLRIYDRFGQEVYRIRDVNDGWDGKGRDVGVYYYYLKYSDVTGKNHFQKGDVTLLR